MPRLAMAASSDTSRMSRTWPSPRIASFWLSVVAVAGGREGSFSNRPKKVTRPSRVTSHRAACQPSCSAISRLSGTPSTTPLAMPPMMMAMALPRCSGVDTAAEVPMPMAR